MGKYAPPLGNQSYNPLCSPYATTYRTHMKSCRLSYRRPWLLAWVVFSLWWCLVMMVYLWHVCQWCKNSAASLPQKLCEALVTTPPCSMILVQQTIVILTGRNDVVVWPSRISGMEWWNGNSGMEYWNDLWPLIMCPYWKGVAVSQLTLATSSCLALCAPETTTNDRRTTPWHDSNTTYTYNNIHNS